MNLFWQHVFHIEPEDMFLRLVPIYLVSENHPNGQLKLIRVAHDTKVAVYSGDPHHHIYTYGYQLRARKLTDTYIRLCHRTWVHARLAQEIEKSYKILLTKK